MSVQYLMDGSRLVRRRVGTSAWYFVLSEIYWVAFFLHSAVSCTTFAPPLSAGRIVITPSPLNDIVTLFSYVVVGCFELMFHSWLAAMFLMSVWSSSGSKLLCRDESKFPKKLLNGQLQGCIWGIKVPTRNTDYFGRFPLGWYLGRFVLTFF